MKRHAGLLWIALLVILSFPAVRAVIEPGFFPMHDDTQVARVIVMGKALSEGQFPVRWVSDLGYGYGYPIFNFYGPLPYYFGGVLYAFGLPALTATKVMFVTGLLLPAFIMYAVLLALAGPAVAVVSAVTVLYAPYHAVQAYVRGSVGEFWVLGFWPLILYSFAAGHSVAWKRKVIVGATGVAGAVLSHTLMGYVTVLFVLAAALVSWVARIKTEGLRNTALTGGLALALGLSLSAFFSVPAISEMRYTSVAGQVGATADFHDHFICPGQFVESAWGYGGSAAGCADGMSFVLGKLHMLLVFAGLTAFAVTGRKVKPSAWEWTGLGLFIAGLFFSVGASQAVWDAVPGFAFLQYPWRFLSVTVMGMGLLAGVLVRRIPHRAATALAVVLSLAVVLQTGKRFVPQYRYAADSGRFESAEDLRWRVSKISDEYLPESFVRPDSPKDTASDTIQQTDGVTSSVLRENQTEVNVLVTAREQTLVTVNRAYFPGWSYAVNGKTVTPGLLHGLPRITVPAGQSTVTAVFTDTPVRRLGNLVSLAALFVCAALAYGKKGTIIG